MLPSQNCDIPESVCCPTLFDIAAHLLGRVYFGLRDCYPVSDCNPDSLLAYVTLGPGDDGVVDAVTVAIEQVAPSPLGLVAKGTSQHPASPMRAVFVVRLRESGWPTGEVKANEILLPDPVMQNALARHAYSHGEKMYRVLSSLIAAGEVFPDGKPQPGFVQLSPLRPLTPSGGVVGFVTAITVDLPWGKG